MATKKPLPPLKPAARKTAGTKPSGMKKGAWIIPVNVAILFGVLCFWAIEQHDTVWAVIAIVMCMLKAYFAVRWFLMRRASKR